MQPMEAAVLDEYKVKPLQELVVMTKQGDSEAQFEIGRRFLYGEGGAKRDYPFALQMITPAADNGCVQAQYTLGLMYEKGLGVDADIEKAIAWYDKAQRQGHESAKLRLERLSPSVTEDVHQKDIDDSIGDSTKDFRTEQTEYDVFEMEDVEFVDENPEEDIKITSDRTEEIKDPVLYKTRAMVDVLCGDRMSAIRDAEKAALYSENLEEEEQVDYLRFQLSIITGKDCSRLSVPDVVEFSKISKSNGEYKGRFGGILFQLFLSIWILIGIIGPLLVFIIGMLDADYVLTFPAMLELFLIGLPGLVQALIFGFLGHSGRRYKRFLKSARPCDVVEPWIKEKFTTMVMQEGEEKAKKNLLDYVNKEVKRQRRKRKISKALERCITNNYMVRIATKQILEGLVKGIMR